MDDMHFDFDDLPDDVTEELAKLMGIVMQEHIKDLPDMLCEKFPRYAARFTLDYVTDLAVAVHMLAINFPYALLRVGGFVQIAMIAMDKKADQFNLANFAQVLHAGFAELSPSYAAAVTPELVALASKLLLLDILTSPFPSREELVYDTHFYTQMALDLLGNKPDPRLVGRDTFVALQTMTPEEIEQLDIPPELIKNLRTEYGSERSPHEN